MDDVQKILIAFELHSADGIKECFDNGINPNAVVNGQPLVHSLINMYTRGPQFKKCMQVFADSGLEFDDKALLAVLLDDAAMLEKELNNNQDFIAKKYSLNCTFTPLYEVTLLHICAEYNHLHCATILVKYGADVNAKAGEDANGFGGQTPLFHTVNQHDNVCMEMMKFLLAQKADLSITLKGLIWGRGYAWETFIPAVNLISYAMMGLLRQFQRNEEQIYEVVSLLMKAQYGIDYVALNVPNKYLRR